MRHTRTKKIWKVVCDVVTALHAARPDVRVTEFSLQEGHLHAIVEGDTVEALRFGLHSLPIRLGKAINRALGRKGRVFDDRHHRHVLRTPAEVRYAKAYVLLNRRRHLAKEGRPMEDGLDPFSSAPWFEGWIRPQLLEPPPEETPRITREPRTWLGAIGWKRRGLLSPSEIPGMSKAKRATGASKAPAATSADRRNAK